MESVRRQETWPRMIHVRGLMETERQTLEKLRRTRHELIDFFEAIMNTLTEGEPILMMDNLSVHKRLEVR